MSATIQVPQLDDAPVKEAADAQRAAAARLANATAALKVAIVAANAATSAAALAVGDPLALAKAERDAQDTLAFQHRVVGICEKQVNDATKAQAEAYAEAHRPIHDAGVKIRLLACAQADVARAELAEAEAEFRRGTALVNRAREKGCRAASGMDGTVLTTPVHTVSYEKAMWGMVE